MKLTLEQIKGITLGAVKITEEDDGVNFFRFTESQIKIYNEKRKFDLAKKTLCTSGVQFSFKTNSKKLFLKALTEYRGTRRYFAFEIFTNGERLGILSNFQEGDPATVYANAELPDGEFQKEFDLGVGDKEVKVIFPWGHRTVIKEISLDDGAYIEPIKPERKLLCFGDSITHGYDALYPSDKYATRLAAALGAEEFNKAIGGDMFFPELVLEKEDFVPDVITVAYGTNDWYWSAGDKLEENCRAFYKNLRETYPETKIYAITPIWRKDMFLERPFGDFLKVGQTIVEAVKNLENIKVIRGFDLVPHDEKFFADRRLHPNDEGFKQYFESLIKHIEH